MNKHAALNNFINGLSFPTEEVEEESVKIAEELEGLPNSTLLALAGYAQETEEEKLAMVCASMGGPRSEEWMESFAGTPLYFQAIALSEQELELEKTHLQARLARRQQDQGWEQESNDRDMIEIQKHQLKLELHKLKAQEAQASQAAAMAPVADLAAASAEPAPAGPAAAPAEALPAEAPAEAAVAKLSADRDEGSSRIGNAARGALGAGATGAVVGGTLGAAGGHSARVNVPKNPGLKGVLQQMEASPALRKGVSSLANSKWKLPVAGAALGATTLGLFSAVPGAVGGAFASPKKKMSAMTDHKQEKGLGKAISGLAKSKMDPDRKRALAGGLTKAIKKETKEGDPVKLSADNESKTKKSFRLPSSITDELKAGVGTAKGLSLSAQMAAKKKPQVAISSIRQAVGK